MSNSSCFYCQQTNANMKQCKSCKSVKYCSKHCQRQNWKEHKQACNQYDILDRYAQLFIHMANPREEQQWFKLLINQKQCSHSLLLSLVYYPEIPENPMYACYIHIPEPLGSGGWEFVQIATGYGHVTCYPAPANHNIIMPVLPQSIPVINTQLPFDDVCSIIKLYRSTGDNSIKYSEEIMKSYKEVAVAAAASQHRFLLIQCTQENKKHYTLDPLLNHKIFLFVLLDNTQFSLTPEAIDLSLNRPIIKSEKTYNKYLLKISNRLKQWLSILKKCVLDSNSEQLNELAHLFCSVRWHVLGDQPVQWPLPTVNLDLSHINLIKRLYFLIEEFINDNDPSRNIFSYERKENPTEKQILSEFLANKKNLSPHIYVSNIPNYDNETQVPFSCSKSSKDVWHIAKIEASGWGRFISSLTLHLSPRTTVLTGLTNSGKTTLLLAVESILLFMESDLYLKNDMIEHKLPFEDSKYKRLSDRLMTLLRRVHPKLNTLDNSNSDSPAVMVEFTHSTGIVVIAHLSFAVRLFQEFVRFNLKRSKSESINEGLIIQPILQTDYGNHLNVATDIVPIVPNSIENIRGMETTISDNATEFMDCQRTTKFSKLSFDTIMDPLFRLHGVNHTLIEINELMQQFFPGNNIIFKTNNYFYFASEKVEITQENGLTTYDYRRSYDYRNDYLIRATDNTSSVYSVFISTFGAGIQHMLEIFIKSLCLKYTTSDGPKLLILDEPDRSLDRPTLKLCAQFLKEIRQNYYSQCLVATHAYEIIAHMTLYKSNKKKINDKNTVDIRFLTKDGILEENAEQMLEELCCHDTFKVMRYLNTDKMLRILLLENQSDEKFFKACFEAFYQQEDIDLWKKKCFVLVRSTRIDSDAAYKAHLYFNQLREGIKVFAVFDQDVYLDMDLDEEVSKWNQIRSANIQYHRWNRRCMESYLFDDIEIIDSLWIGKQTKPSEILNELIKKLYDDIKKSVEKKATDKTKHLLSNITIPPSDVEGWLSEKQIDLHQFAEYETDIRQSLIDAVRKSQANQEIERQLNAWLVKRKIPITLPKEWDNDSLGNLYKWANAHLIIKTLKRLSGVNLEDYSILLTLLKNRNDKNDGSLSEVKSVLERILKWLKD